MPNQIVQAPPLLRIATNVCSRCPPCTMQQQVRTNRSSLCRDVACFCVWVPRENRGICCLAPGRARVINSPIPVQRDESVCHAAGARAVGAATEIIQHGDRSLRARDREAARGVAGAVSVVAGEAARDGAVARARALRQRAASWVARTEGVADQHVVSRSPRCGAGRDARVMIGAQIAVHNHVEPTRKLHEDSHPRVHAGLRKARSWFLRLAVIVSLF
jgi:hypothetical protein